MPKPSPRVQALRDVLLAVLQDTDVPLSTHEVVAKAFPGSSTYRHYSKVYSNLRAMDRLGLVTWHPWDEAMQCARWSAVAEPAIKLAELEALWRLGSTR